MSNYDVSTTYTLFHGPTMARYLGDAWKKNKKCEKALSFQNPWTYSYKKQLEFPE